MNLLRMCSILMVSIVYVCSIPTIVKPLHKNTRKGARLVASPPPQKLKHKNKTHYVNMMNA